MYILGLNAYHADSSAALLKDGELIVAIEEERFRRIKHWAGFPAEAVRFCINEAGITIDDVEYIGIGREPSAKVFKKFLFVMRNPGIGLTAIRERLKNAQQIATLEKEFSILFPETKSTEIVKKIRKVEHHRSHLASAFYASPFKEAALLSIDGSGDFTTTMFGKGIDEKIDVLGSIDFPHSIGIFYSALTQFLGFPHYGDEYKVMGLAPYGRPLYNDKLRKVLRIETNGRFNLDLSYFTVTKGNIISYGQDHIPKIEKLFSKKLEDLLGPPRNTSDEINQYHRDIAASVQLHTEETIFHLLIWLYEKTKLTSVCIAGGVAQNSVANGKVTRNTPFKEVYIPSAGHDAGISMGSALYIWHQILGQKRSPPIMHAYLGSRYTNDEIKAILESSNLKNSYYNDDQLFEIVADKLVDGNVIGWFSGRAEFGPRALGGRSILVDPRRNDAKELLNAKIKRRESFRPFAPSILSEFVDDFFEINERVPFMEKVFPIRNEKKHLIPAVTHVDGSGRLQTVTEKDNPRYYKLIKKFLDKTGIPILLNTSFNENEPIVNHPREAIDCFKRTRMDMLVLENYVIERNESNTE